MHRLLLALLVDPGLFGLVERIVLWRCKVGVDVGLRRSVWEAARH